MQEEDFYDERTGQALSGTKVKAARDEEVKFMSDIDLYEEESWAQTGKGPTSPKWVDVKLTLSIRFQTRAKTYNADRLLNTCSRIAAQRCRSCRAVWVRSRIAAQRYRSC